MRLLLLPLCCSLAGSIDLIPPAKSLAHHYYTTWATQGYMPGCGASNLTVDWICSHQHSHGQWQALDMDHVFGNKSVIGSGWATKFYPQSRGELYFVLDEGYATAESGIELNPVHFPEFGGKSSDPAQRLARFQEAVQQLGWRGLGLWTRMSKASDAAKYAKWCKEANITYWKIDGPDLDCSCQRAAQKVFPELVIEHGHCPKDIGCPLNNPSGSGEYDPSNAKEQMSTLGCSDVLRSYDTVPTLSIVTTLSRLSTIMSVANHSLPPGTNKALLNGDAESYVTNSLGCNVAAMRSPVYGLRPVQFGNTSRDVDLFFAVLAAHITCISTRGILKEAVDAMVDAQ